MKSTKLHSSYFNFLTKSNREKQFAIDSSRFRQVLTALITRTRAFIARRNATLVLLFEKRFRYNGSRTRVRLQVLEI